VTHQQIDTFIGHKFGKDDQLCVIGWDGTRATRGYNKVYTVKCTKCAEDTELFADATFRMVKGNILRGSVPCGCAIQRNWEPWQYKVRATRAAKSLNFTILDYCEELVKSDTDVVVECETCKKVWTKRVASLLMGYGCLHCKNKAAGVVLTKPENVVITEFVESGAFVPGTTFSKTEPQLYGGRLRALWEVICPLCSSDEFVRAGLCSGVFVSDSHNLRSGKLPCRCSTKYRWTKEQREYQVRKVCERSQLYKFVGWLGGVYKNAYSRVVMQCSDHGEYSVGVSGFVAQGTRCPDCAKTGFNLRNAASVYILQAVGRYSFTGYGISREADRRLSEHSRNLKRVGFTIGQTQIYPMTGQQAWDLEKVIKAKFPLNPQDIPGFRTEATYYEHYQAVCDFVDKWLFENT